MLHFKKVILKVRMGVASAKICTQESLESTPDSLYAMPNSSFHFATSPDSCVHKRHFVNSATYES